MASATVTGVYYNTASGWVNKGSAYWSEYEIAQLTRDGTNYAALYEIAIDIPENQYISAFSVSAYTRAPSTNPLAYRVTMYLYENDPRYSEHPGLIANGSTSSLQKGTSKSETKRLSISSSKRYGQRYAYLYVERSTYGNSVGYFTLQGLSVTGKNPALSVEVSPVQTTAGEQITVITTGRAGQSLNLKLTANNVDLTPTQISVNTDTKTITTDLSWFDTAAESGNTLNVTATITDPNDGRTASAAFTLDRPSALSVTPTAPKSISIDITDDVTFAWSVSGSDGTQDYAELQYSYDNANWYSLGSISGSGTTLEKSAGFFSAGTVHWRIRVRSTYGVWSAWSSASFTVSYRAASITLTTPTSGQRDGSGEIPFAWNITNGSGSIVKTIMEVSTDDGLSWIEKVNKNEKATSYTASAAEFPSGTLKWRVKAKNQYQDDYTVSSTGSVTIVYSAVSQISPVNSPTSGRVPASVDQTYAVALTPSAPVYTPFTVQSATMYWRAGTSGDYTAVPMTSSGANASVTIHGGTFPSGTVQWYAEAVDNTGATRTTDVYTLLALNADVEAVPLSPINTIEGTSSEITFSWLYYSLDGTAQSRALLEYSRDGESWDTIADVPGSDTTYTARAGFFAAAGIVYWRVQAFNASGTGGPKSEPVSFTLFGSSSVTSVIGDGRPFATVKWQAEGQVSYELMIGDMHIGPYFGADVRSYKLAVPLEDGIYTVKVRIQNKYSIWSEWAEAQMSVQNQPGLGISIRDAQSGLIDARYTYRGNISILSWASGDFFMILRDGKYIGKTTRLYFEDRIPIGVHSYQVFQALADGYVDRSNIITIDIKTKCPVIAPLAGGDFIELRLSTDEDRAQDFQRSREVVRMRYSGTRWPVSEVGEAETLSATFDAAWPQADKAAADAFEALVGEDVILKTPGGKFIVGTLEGYELHDLRFYKSYRCTLQQGDWRDFTNADA